MARDPIKNARNQIKYWQKMLTKLESEANLNSLDRAQSLERSSIKESEKEEREKVPPHPSIERNEEKEKESRRPDNARAREENYVLVFPKRATAVDIPPDDMLTPLEPGLFQIEKPPSFFDLFRWVRKRLRLSHSRDKDVIDWWNALCDSNWFDGKGNKIKNWPLHLRTWLNRSPEFERKRNPPKRQSSDINSGLRLRGGTLSPKILEKLKELENGIE